MLHQIYNNPFHIKNQGKYKWNRVLHVRGEVQDYEFDRLAGIGICLSPNWINETQKHKFLELMTSHNYLDEKTRIRFNSTDSLCEKKEFDKLNKKFLYCIEGD